MATTAPQPADPPPPRGLVGTASLMWTSLAVAITAFGVGIALDADYSLSSGPIDAVAFGPVVIVSLLAPLAACIGWWVVASRVSFVREHWAALAMAVAVLSLLQLVALSDAVAAGALAAVHLGVGGVVAAGVPRLLGDTTA